MYNIILASASPRRKELLKQIGFEFTCIPSHKEEVFTEISPENIVKQLALLKAEDIAGQVSDQSIIIGADTIVVHDNEVLGKPKNKDHAYQILNKLQGNRHRVYTGVCIIVKEEDSMLKFQFADRTEVCMYPMTEQEINDYIHTEEPMDKAGAYAIQGIGSSFVEKIIGDYNTVVGFPLSRFYQIMKEFGYGAVGK